MTALVLDIDNLVVGLNTKSRHERIIDGVSLKVRERETLCLVGESGSGKSVTSLTVMGLLQKGSLVPTGGSIKLVGEELLGASAPFCNRPITVSEVTDLPDPLSPTRHSVSRSLTRSETPSMIRS